jgi:pimeloyl-ACP methyl ester carboxylesterase
MSAILALWLVGGAIVLALMALVTVFIARGMEKTHRKETAAADGEEDDDETDDADDDSEDEAEGKEKDDKSGWGWLGTLGFIKGPAIAIAVIGGVGAFIGNLFEGDVDVASLPRKEIAAGELHGTLLSAGEKRPVVLIVPGSGPTDRDGNNPLGVNADSYRLLAEALAAQGISSVRVDKRGMFASRAAGDANAVTVAAYAEDYRAWIDAIRAETGRKCVWLLGHSEGALMVSAAAEGRKDVCGLILVAGMGRRLGDVLRGQLQANPANAPLIDQAFAAIADLEAGRHTDTSAMHPALLPLFAPAVQDFLISMMAQDPVELVRRARVKTLIVQGTADLQVTLEDARLLDKAPRTTLRSIAGMNHVLKDSPGDRAANLATYSNPGLPLAPRLAAVIEDFIEDDD